MGLAGPVVLVEQLHAAASRLRRPYRTIGQAQAAWSVGLGATGLAAALRLRISSLLHVADGYQRLRFFKEGFDEPIQLVHLFGEIGRQIHGLGWIAFQIKKFVGVR